MSYQVFTRNWYKKSLSGELEPDPRAHKHNIVVVSTEREARDKCREGNESRPKSWHTLSRKYEYTER